MPNVMSILVRVIGTCAAPCTGSSLSERSPVSLPDLKVTETDDELDVGTLSAALPALVMLVTTMRMVVMRLLLARPVPLASTKPPLVMIVLA